MRTLLFSIKSSIQTPSKAFSGEISSQDGQGVPVAFHTPSKAISGESPSQDGQGSQGVTLNTPKGGSFTECTSSDPLTVTKKIKRQRPFQNEEHESLLLQRELIKIQREWLDVEKERLGIERERLYIERRRLEMEERTRGVCTAYKQPEERRTLQMDHELFHGAFMQI